MNKVLVVKETGTFAENKDVARKIREQHITPALMKNEEILLDFQSVTGATQSFIHALISDPMRKFGTDSLDLIIFKNCTTLVKEIITTVTEYMQES